MIPRPTILGQACRDSSGHESSCPYWAKTGQCDKNPDWMLVNCKKSCSSKIKDSNPSCPAWAKLGECTKNPSWMLPNCKLSCMRIKCWDRMRWDYNMIIYYYSNCTLRAPEKKTTVKLMKLKRNKFLTLMISILTMLLEPLPQQHLLNHYGQYERRRA